MRNEENSTQVFSSEQLKTVQDMIGENEPSLFSVLQELSKKYDEKTTIYLTKEFCVNCQTHENQLVGMEFLYQNSFFDDLEKMIKFHKESSNSLNNEWSLLYELQIKRKVHNIIGQDFLKLLEDVEVREDATLLSLLTFLKIYGYYEMYEYEKLEIYQDVLTKYLLDIDNTIIRVYFQLRENELYLHYHWKRNEVQIARNYGHNMLENVFNPRKKCYTHLILAETYVLEDYNKAMEHANKALEIAEYYNLVQFIKDANNKVIPFIAAINGIYEGVETTDEVERAHLYLAAKRWEDALQILNKIQNPTPFQEYYLGLAKKDKDLLQKSYYRFLTERKDQFFALLPYQELNNLAKEG
ncbi:AimR family lysis-lysogeny pheromone receptor [Pontibacillus marinus]|uniref:Uncharacterized protein n=1 Tax=Pontibacillus marinus BH030004 = DSM 16465 TaxID=1385511 RepID=A0A0A5GE63_9BACI|nr:AimR family lysis-lysogeny pheromone receptor [Pontibacillus marinus]KGX90304.1 hypothetical protein N783_21170 [Pontibacillus marinus BH030004 = DSM 16465]